ncbi:hypothetical protein RF11_07862 [Thelohanellus kitauei]|uniref:Uncharacterized protein n=1 Tax=Thelohanellus kitauei TaxID=669202 RepID=A0A0C2ICX3_THEKT|nr:hypothetical protein RF11_07862 [Thelohanellus kitauei]
MERKRKLSRRSVKSDNSPQISSFTIVKRYISGLLHFASSQVRKLVLLTILILYFYSTFKHKKPAKTPEFHFDQTVQQIFDDLMFVSRTNDTQISFIDIPVITHTKNKVIQNTDMPTIFLVPSFSFGAIEFHKIYEFFYKYQRVVIFDSLQAPETSPNNFIKHLDEICDNIIGSSGIFVGYGDYSFPFMKLASSTKACKRFIDKIIYIYDGFQKPFESGNFKCQQNSHFLELGICSKMSESRKFLKSFNTSHLATFENEINDKKVEITYLNLCDVSTGFSCKNGEMSLMTDPSTIYEVIKNLI